MAKSAAFLINQPNGGGPNARPDTALGDRGVPGDSGPGPGGLRPGPHGRAEHAGDHRVLAAIHPGAHEAGHGRLIPAESQTVPSLAGAAWAAPVPFSAAGIAGTRIVATGEGLLAAGADWQALARRGAKIPLFQDHAWLSAWWRAVAAAEKTAQRYALHVVVLDDAHGPAAIAPLAVRRDAWPRRLVWMAADVGDYCDLIAAPGIAAGAEAAPVWPALRAAMAASGAALAELTQIRPDGVLAGLSGASPEAGPKAMLAPFIALEGKSWEQVEQGFSAQLRQEMRRKGRRLAKRMSWAYVEAVNAAQRQAAVEFTIAEKRRQLADDPAAAEQHERVFAPFARAIFAAERVGAARTHVSVLEAGGTILAAHLGFVDAERFYYWVPAYNPDFQADSPGQLLIYELVRRATEARVPIFDMLRGDYRYKWRLTDKAVELQTLSETLSLAGAGYLRAKALAKRVLGR
jgi:CelD/BcsL family acetyltransferase involved in cellulose biosynthesis